MISQIVGLHAAAPFVNRNVNDIRADATKVADDFRDKSEKPDSEQ